MNSNPRRRRRSARSQRLGEIGIIGVAAVIANAVFHASGKRIRDFPITRDKLLWEVRDEDLDAGRSSAALV